MGQDCWLTAFTSVYYKLHNWLWACGWQGYASSQNAAVLSVMNMFYVLLLIVDLTSLPYALTGTVDSPVAALQVSPALQQHRCFRSPGRPATHHEAWKAAVLGAAAVNGKR